MSEQKFMTAEWRKLIMANYAVDASVLLPYLPAGTELDEWQGKNYISLVGFLFKEVRIKGFKIPFHVNFPEVNLRFYVRFKEKDTWKRGVVFISEIVPKPAITFVANTLYKEHYSTLPMRYSWKEEAGKQLITYEWKKKDKWNRLEAITGLLPTPLKPGSEEEFITEHFWGYSKSGPGKTVEYHVEHPRWDIYPLQQFEVDCDFSSLYGKPFAWLNTIQPDSVFLAEGSPIAVYNKKVIYTGAVIT